ASPSASRCSWAERSSPKARPRRSRPTSACRRSTSGASAMAEIVSLQGVSAGYGEAVVVDDVMVAVCGGGSVALLGRNGSGKTTLLATILGLTHLHRGAIRWKDTDIARWPTHRRARAGIGWVPQERRMWSSLTVDEHLSAVARPGEWDMARVHKLFP